MNILIPKRLGEISKKETSNEELVEATKQEVDVINLELVRLSKSLRPWITAQKRVERRIEHLDRRKYLLQTNITKVTKCPPKVKPYSVPQAAATPSKESVIKKIKGFSQQRLAEFGLYFDRVDLTKAMKGNG